MFLSKIGFSWPKPNVSANNWILLSKNGFFCQKLAVLSKADFFWQLDFCVKTRFFCQELDFSVKNYWIFISKIGAFFKKTWCFCPKSGFLCQKLDFSVKHWIVLSKLDFSNKNWNFLTKIGFVFEKLDFLLKNRFFCQKAGIFCHKMDLSVKVSWMNNGATPNILKNKRMVWCICPHFVSGAKTCWCEQDMWLEIKMLMRMWMMSAWCMWMQQLKWFSDRAQECV